MRYFFIFLFVICGHVLNSALANTQVVKDEIVTDDIVQTKANYWGLEKTEYLKSDQLRLQHKNLISDDLTPVEVLGIFANTKAERKKYARQFAKLIRQTTAKVLAYQDEVNQAHLDLYGSGSMFDYRQAPRQNVSQWHRLNHRIDLLDCESDCENQARKLIETSLVNPVDFYFKNATDDQIRQWASKMGVDVTDVKNKRITLNYAP